MLKKSAVLTCMILSVALLITAALAYPGGTLYNNHAIGFNWTQNYISDLFKERAINGEPNAARFWAKGGMTFLALGFALFFIQFSKKVPARPASAVIRYCGVGSMLFTLLIATVLHDVMIPIASILFLISIGFITAYIFKSRLPWLKIIAVMFHLFFYYSLYLLSAGNDRVLPIMQKVTFVTAIVFITTLEYFTHQQQFEKIRSLKKTTLEAP